MPELTQEQRKPLIYYPQADAQMNQFIPASEFRVDLINRLLLEPGILITDIFFFISKRVEEELSSVNSWIITGIDRELIVPAFRTKDVNFQTVLSEMRSEILGLLEQSGGMAQLLDDTATVGPRITWPDLMGVQFRDVLVKHLTADVPPDSRTETAALWRGTERLRTDVLSGAMDAQRDPDTNGLQRGTLLRQIAKELEFGGDPTDTTRLLDHSKRFAGVTEMKSLSAFLLWVNELYHFNQATNFEVRPSFPVENAVGAGIMSNHLWDSEDISSRVARTAAPENFEFKPIIVQWPTKAMLLEADPVELLAIRCGDDGKRYISTLEKMRRQPTPETWYVLEKHMKTYAARISRQFGDIKTGLSVQHKVVAARTKLLAQLGTMTGTATTAILSAQIGNPLLTTISVAGTIASIVSPVVDYRLARQEASKTTARKKLALRMVPNRTFEVDFPA